MKFFSRFSKRIVFFLAANCGWLVILLFGKLTRTKIINQHHWYDLKKSGKGFLVAVWHGRILLPIYFHRRQKIVGMVSLHGDGEMIARTLIKLGYKTVRGSSTRGGGEALRGLVRELKKGAVGAIMPDGPTGPRHHFKEGALFIAQLAQVPILPMTFSSNRFVQFRSWDRFMLMKPFSKSVIIYGEPFVVPRRLNSEQMKAVRLNIETDLISLEKDADEYF